MDVTPDELRTAELREGWRGYRQADVDRLLDRVASTIERLQAQVQRLSERLSEAEGEAGVGREADEMLRRTLLLAQRTADAAVAEAQERARRVVSESEAHAHSIVSGAEEEARRVAIAERQRVENEIRELSARRGLLVADVEALEGAARDHRRRLRELLEAEIARIDARPLPEVSAVPELSDPALLLPPAEVDLSAEGAVVEEGEPYGAAEEVAAEAAVAVGDAGEIDILPSRRRRWGLRDPEISPPDDEFFDELRRAVTDETPLGPRDDEGDEEAQEYAPRGPSFFDQDDRRADR